MRWGMWGTTLRGLADFVERWDCVDFDFEVRETGYTGIVGKGLLVYIQVVDAGNSAARQLETIS